jgi:GNAT superfamily N-acetyltransferase
VSADPRASDVQIHQLTPDDPRTPAALDVMAALRDAISRDELEARYRAACEEGYVLAGLFDGDECVAAAGVRVSTNLAFGRNCYIDDLVTAPAARSRGYGRMLHEWMVRFATEAGCTTLHLDSRTERKLAHRFYLRERHEIVAFHFARVLGA